MIPIFMLALLLGTLTPEAEQFLHRMPSGIKITQAHAIRQARAGDSRALNQVRRARGGETTTPTHDLTVTDLKIDAIPIRIYRPRHSENSTAVIYCHGGGWVLGSIASCARICREIALAAHVVVIAPEYRLAPEFPYPAAADDVFAVLEWTRANAENLRIAPERIFMAGDSSGGNLAIATALRNIDSKKPPLAGVIAYYPVTIARNDHSLSWQKNQNIRALTGEIMEEFNLAYAPDEDTAKQRYVSPLLADLSGFPPTLIVAAEYDILRDQGKRFADRLAPAVRYRELPGTIHLFITMPGMDEAFRQALNETVLFLTDRVF